MTDQSVIITEVLDMPKIVDKAERRTTLLIAAMSVFAELGYHRATMQAVADRAGVSKGSLYDSFDSKEALLVDLARWFSTEFIAPIFAVLETDLDAPITTRIERFADAAVGAVDEWIDGAFTVLQIWAELGRKEDRALRAIMSDLYTQSVDQLQAALDAAVAQGELRAFDTRAAAVAICAAIDGATLQAILLPKDLRAAVDAGAFRHLCLGAIAPGATP